MKDVITAGEGFDKPSSRDEVVLNLVAKDGDGQVLYEGKGVTCYVHSPPLAPCVGTILQSMLIGETSQVRVLPGGGTLRRIGT